MKTLIAVAFAAIYGLSLRILFGFMGDIVGVMSISFLVLLPVIIGYLTVIFIPRNNKLSGTAAFFLPFLTSLVILIVTIMLSMEGAICWIMIFPLFAILAGIGGSIAHNHRKRRDKADEENNEWERKDTLKVSFIALLPIVLGFVEGDKTLTHQEYTIVRQVAINASPGEVWEEVLNVNTVAPKEKDAKLTNLLGFPRHLQTTKLDTIAVGGKRMAYYEKGLFFEETVSAYEHEKLLVLDVKADPKKIPPTVLDEHIVIGGKHVDILQDKYELEEFEDGRSHLILTSKFYINTPFNWYAGIWAKYLMNDILDGQLHLIRKRAVAKEID